MKREMFCRSQPGLRWASRTLFFDNSGSRNGWSEALVAGVCGIDAQRDTRDFASRSTDSPQATQPYRVKQYEHLFAEQMLSAKCSCDRAKTSLRTVSAQLV